MGSGGVAIAALFIVICLEVSFSDGLWGGYNQHPHIGRQRQYGIDNV